MVFKTVTPTTLNCLKIQNSNTLSSGVNVHQCAKFHSNCCRIMAIEKILNLTTDRFNTWFYTEYCEDWSNHCWDWLVINFSKAAVHHLGFVFGPHMKPHLFVFIIVKVWLERKQVLIFCKFGLKMLLDSQITGFW